MGSEPARDKSPHMGRAPVVLVSPIDLSYGGRVTETDAEADEDGPPQSDELAHRVKGETHQGPIPAKDILRIVVIGIPVMIAAWYFLLWMKGGFR